MTVERSPLVELAVEARCFGASLEAFVATDGTTLPFLAQVTDGRGTALPRDGRRFTLPHGDRTQIRYRVALEAMGHAVDDFDVALSLGGAVLSPLSAWLLVPDPTLDDAPVRIHVTTPAGVAFETALRRSGNDGAYVIAGHELRVGTYTVFGAFDATTLALPGPGALAATEQRDRNASIRVVRLRARSALTAREVDAWVEETSNAVARFYRGFPVQKAMVVVVPVRRRTGTVFGKVLPAGGSGVVMLVGARSTPEVLRRDWVLVHELFHLGTPSYVGEGKWLDEGLATYFEPIIRAREGWLDEDELWTELAGGLHQGVDALVRTGLENPASFRAHYWGGALVALSADVRARRASAGRRGLEDGLRAVTARGGTADQVWALAETVRTVDEALGAPILADLVDAHGHRGSPFDLGAMLRDLGIDLGPNGARLRDDAPLASVRRSIAAGAPLD